MSCCLPFCSYKGLKTSTFGVPKKGPLMVEWEKSLGVKLREKSRICQYHFKNEDILKTWVSGQGISKYTICLKRPKLRVGAVPIKSELLEFSHTSPVLINFESNVVPSDTNQTFDIMSNIHKDHSYSLTNMNKTQPIENTSSNYELVPPPKRIKEEKMTLFQKIQSEINLLNIPQKWVTDIGYVNNLMIISFHKLGPFNKNFTRAIEKQIIFTEKSQLLLYVYGNKIDVSNIGYSLDIQIQTYGQLEDIIKTFDQVQVCHGAMSCCSRKSNGHFRASCNSGRQHCPYVYSKLQLNLPLIKTIEL